MRQRRSALIELSRHVFEPLRRDEDSILYRGHNHEDLSQVLVLAPAREGARPESLKRLEHEYSFKAELDPEWAARPIAITFHWNRPVLVLEDPGIRLTLMIFFAGGSSFRPFFFARERGPKQLAKTRRFVRSEGTLAMWLPMPTVQMSDAGQRERIT